MDNYILRLKNKLACFYYGYETKEIFCKTFENNMWGKPTSIVKSCNSDFTVNISDCVYVFCNVIDKGVFKYSTKDFNDWSYDKLSNTNEEYFNAYIFGKGMIYNRNNIIFLKNNSIEEVLDTFVPINNTFFESQFISDEHVLIFYQSKESESVKLKRSNIFFKEEVQESYRNIGYMEVSVDDKSKFKPIHTTQYQIVDVSFITTYNVIHALYIVKSLFSYQLVYKCKVNQEFDTPIVVWEGQKIENCLISIVNNIIYVFFQYRNQIFVSKKRGLTFTKPEIYKYKICNKPKKAIYITEDKMDENEIFLRNVYVDTYSPWDIQIIPDLYETFYYFKNSELVLHKDEQQEIPILQEDPNIKKDILIQEESSKANIDSLNKDVFINNPNSKSVIANEEVPPHWNIPMFFENIQPLQNDYTQKQKNQTSLQIDPIAQEKKYYEKIQKLNNRITELEANENKLMKEIEILILEKEESIQVNKEKTKEEDI